MILSKKLKTFLLALGDLILFYFSLYLTLALRHWSPVDISDWGAHQIPFLYILILWLFCLVLSLTRRDKLQTISLGVAANSLLVINLALAGAGSTTLIEGEPSFVRVSLGAGVGVSAET